jgi:hypothetical protein
MISTNESGESKPRLLSKSSSSLDIKSSFRPATYLLIGNRWMQCTGDLQFITRVFEFSEPQQNSSWNDGLSNFITHAIRYELCWNSRTITTFQVKQQFAFGFITSFLFHVHIFKTWKTHEVDEVREISFAFCHTEIRYFLLSNEERSIFFSNK